MLNLRSKPARAVLGYFMLNDEAEAYVNELARQLELDSGNLARKLRELEKTGVLRSVERGRERYYSLNPDFPLLKEYKQIVLKTVGIEHTLREALTKVNGVKRAFIFGSYASGAFDAASDIDLLVIGSHKTLDVLRVVATIQKAIGREINVVNMDEAEYRRRSASDHFVKTINHGNKVELI